MTEIAYEALTTEDRVRIARTWIARRFMGTAEQSLDACDEALVNDGERKLTKAERKEAQK